MFDVHLAQKLFVSKEKHIELFDKHCSRRLLSTAVSDSLQNGRQTKPVTFLR